MSRLALPALAVALLLVSAGCATGGQPTTTTPGTTAASPSTTKTTPTTTSGRVTTLPDTRALPFSVRNDGDANRTVRVRTAANGSVVHEETVTLAPGDERRVYMLTGYGHTYRIMATTQNATLSRNVTVQRGLLRSGVVVNATGGLEYIYVVN